MGSDLSKHVGVAAAYAAIRDHGKTKKELERERSYRSVFALLGAIACTAFPAIFVFPFVMIVCGSVVLTVGGALVGHYARAFKFVASDLSSIFKAASGGNWYYMDRGTKVGPMSEEAFANAVRSRKVRRNTQVFGPGFSAWTRAGDVPVKGVK